MKLKVGVELLSDKAYTYLINDLAPYAPCVVMRDGDGVSVEVEGDIVRCMSVVAICDHYRFGGVEDE